MINDIFALLKAPPSEGLGRKNQTRMIITFATQKGGTGKTTLAIAFANYLSGITTRKIKVYDFDYQKSFFNKWREDADSELPKLYEVEVIGEDDDEPPFEDLEQVVDLKESKDLFLFDLAGTLDQRYSDVLVYSDFIIIPFEYSDVSVKSTLVFKNLLGLLESEAERIFIRSKYDKGYKYLNQKEMDIELAKYGTLLENPVFKRNCLQTIDTRKLTYEQKYAVKKPFDEIIQKISEVKKVAL